MSKKRFIEVRNALTGGVRKVRLPDRVEPVKPTQKRKATPKLDATVDESVGDDSGADLG